MTAPNIKMIANSLRNCSLTRTSTASASPSSSSSSSAAAAALPPEERDGVTVELNSDVALPYHWEQCLDISTGQVYYINWEDGTRTTMDPRNTQSYSSTYYHYCPSNCSSQEEEEQGENEYYYNSSSDADSCSGINPYAENNNSSDNTSLNSSNLSSTLSSFSPTESSSNSSGGAARVAFGVAGNGGQVLVAAGCRSCFMYFMVPKHLSICPKCSGNGLLHLGRNSGVSAEFI